MRTREVAEICGVTNRTVTGNAAKAGIILENGKVHDWTEEEVKKLQLVLMNNTQNRGNASTLGNVVEDTARDALQGGLTIQELIASGNVAALDEFMQIARNATIAQHELKLQQEQNKLLIEERNVALQEAEDIKQYNKNFHNELFTATEVADRLGISANYVGRLANKLHLKQEPIWGKLGKIQLNNGKWVDQFYYNEDAVKAMEAQF